MKTKIKNIIAREILDSRGNPTVEARVVLSNGITEKASVPSGASTGVHEALELRDNDKQRYNGKGVLKAVENVNEIIASKLSGLDVTDQHKIDQLMLEIDGTENKAKLGANAILGVSLACAKTAALAQNKPLYQYIKETYNLKFKEYKLPVPSFNILNGGRHADNNLEFQEFMLYPQGVKTFAEKMRCGAEIFHTLKKLLHDKNFSTGIGDEGGFAPNLRSNEQALDLIIEAVQTTKWKMDKDVFIALDPASSEFYVKEKYVIKNNKLSTKEMINFWQRLVKKYPIVSIEDALAEDDWAGWTELNEKIGEKVQLVGDDFLVTNPKRIQEAIDKKACNAVLIKVNQIGSLTEAVYAIKKAQDNGWGVMVSHRSGETTDTFIADLVVGTNAGQIKSGSLSRGERLAKYNRISEIELELKS